MPLEMLFAQRNHAKNLRGPAKIAYERNGRRKRSVGYRPKLFSINNGLVRHTCVIVVSWRRLARHLGIDEFEIYAE